MKTTTKAKSMAAKSTASVVPSFKPLLDVIEKAHAALRAGREKYLNALAAHMRAAGLKRLELDYGVEYSYYDDHEDNDGEVVAIKFDGDRLYGVDDDMLIGLDRLKAATIFEMAQIIVWPEGKSGVVVSQPA